MDAVERVERLLWPDDDAIAIVKCGDLRELISLARSNGRSRAVVEAIRRAWFCSGSDCTPYDHGRDEGLQLAVDALDRLRGSEDV